MKGLALPLLVFPTLSLAQDLPVPQVFQAIQPEKGAWRVELVQAPTALAAAAPYTVCANDPLAAITYEKRPSPCQKRLVKDTADEALEEAACPTGTSTAELKRQGNSVILKQTSAASQVSTWRFTPLGACRSAKDKSA